VTILEEDRHVASFQAMTEESNYNNFNNNNNINNNKNQSFIL
jgi:hypothetical protein